MQERQRRGMGHVMMGHKVLLKTMHGALDSGIVIYSIIRLYLRQMNACIR
jgi:hypothetical protein